MLARLLLLFAGVFLLGFLTCLFLPSLLSLAGYSRDNGSGYNSTYNTGYQNGYGGRRYGNSWGQPAYAAYAPYPRPRRRVAPSPCYSPCDY